MANTAAKVKKKVFWLLFLLFVPVCLCYLFPFSFIERVVERDYSRYYIEGATYRFNANTILNAIKNSNDDIFTLQTETPKENDAEAMPSVRWRQADFINVLTTFQQRFVNKTAYNPDLPRKIYPSKMRVERPKKEQLSDETTKT